MRCAILAAALVLGTPAFADPPADYAPDGRLSNSSAGEVIDPRQSTDPGLDGCVRLMEQAFNMADPASFGRAIDARHEMELARSAFHNGDEFACNRHAIHALEDRT
ncbi:MAG TPA: hypothetical protein VG889_21950 [Rhizomicrobium sp.]|nr:hypothetical protein [Rhizomicrobium sp.]